MYVVVYYMVPQNQIVTIYAILCQFLFCLKKIQNTDLGFFHLNRVMVDGAKFEVGFIKWLLKEKKSIYLYIWIEVASKNEHAVTT